MYANDDEKPENVTQCFLIEKWSDTFFPLDSYRTMITIAFFALLRFRSPDLLSRGVVDSKIVRQKNTRQR